MVKNIHRPKATARSKKTGHAGSDVGADCGGAHHSQSAQDQEQYKQEASHLKDIGSGRSFGTAEDQIRQLLSDHFGDSIHLSGFRFDLETSDGEVRVEWWSKVPRA